jgi:hypothetical protein
MGWRVGGRGLSGGLPFRGLKGGGFVEGCSMVLILFHRGGGRGGAGGN